LACKRTYPVDVDETAKLFDVISVSAGVRGTQILLAPSDYLAAVKGVIGAIARSRFVSRRRVCARWPLLVCIKCRSGEL
jgi:hypothetical protein